MRVRILHVVEALGVGGGVETGIANLIETMDSKRFEHLLCAVFRLGTQTQRYAAGHAQMFCLDQRPRKFAVQTGPIAGLIRTLRPHVVHSRNWGALESVVAGRWVGGASVIHSEHGVEMDPASEPHRRTWFRRMGFGLAHRVFCVSGLLADLLAARTGFARCKIAVIHNGVNTNRFRADTQTRARCRAELGIRADEFCIGCVGRLSRIKDYPTLLGAAEIFARNAHSWRLLIVGDGADRPELEQLVASRPALQDRVQFLGASERVPEFLNAIDTYVLPSLYEGISNSLLEAMATGLPAIASEAGGNPEAIIDRQSGLLFPVADREQLADRLLLVYNDPALRSSLGKGALRRVQQEFSLAAMVAKYEAMYEELAGANAGRHVTAENLAIESAGGCR